ncbi:MAG TPA: discoidin domain-containing protein [Caulobacteraceae bacterium]
MKAHPGPRRLILTVITAAASHAAAAWGAPPVADTVTIDLTGPSRTIVPDEALGAAIDGMQQGQVAQILTPRNIALMKSAGLRRATYRLRTELGIEAWHWSEEGRWSDPARHQGYWTSSDHPSRHPDVTWGYSLPRRGDTIDQANDTGYSRLDDGDRISFWKSNPYLDRHFTGLSPNRPQWVVVSFDRPQPIDAARIAWAQPYASAFEIQYWTGKNESDRAGRWVDFPAGPQRRDRFPGDETIRLANAPVSARFVRILLTRSSGTKPSPTHDVRDRLGYAIAEIGLGVIGPDGGFVDAVRHGAGRYLQTDVNVSSTDPWHRAIDRDPHTEQPSLDLIFRDGLNGNMPLLVPVGVFYDTPENAAAEASYIRRRGWPVRRLELGEEPDGQFIAPEDYADLYLEAARRIRKVAPEFELGGPSMQGALTDTWPVPDTGRSWVGRFVVYLRERHALGELQFFSFEHYAFDDVCRPLGVMLRDETQQLDHILDRTIAAGMPTSIPWMISEYGLSPFSGQAMSLVPSALFSADVVGHFLSRGGHAAFMFGYTPGRPWNQAFPCAGYGDMMLFETDAAGQSRWPMPMFFAQSMMIHDWGAPSGQPHRLFAAAGEATDAQGRPMVLAYALKRRDGTLSVMLLNRDQEAAHEVSMRVRDAVADPSFPVSGASVVQYSPAQYAWLDRGPNSQPARDLPPARFDIAAGPVILPAMSLTVVTARSP